MPSSHPLPRSPRGRFTGTPEPSPAPPLPVEIQSELPRARRTLGTAVRTGEAELFGDYSRWLAALCRARGAPPLSARRLLEVVGRAACAEAPPGERDAVLAVLDHGIAALEDPGSPGAAGGREPDPRLAEYVQALLTADRRRARRVVTDAMAAGESATDVIFGILQPAQREIGDRWLAGEVSVALEHLATATTGQLLGEVYASAPRRAANGLRVVTVCAAGELHEIGARIVADILELEGWSSLYVGADTPIDDALDLLGESNPNLLAISVTLSANLLGAVKLVRVAGERLPDLRVIVGGNVFSALPDLWRRIGADGTASDASEVPALGERLCGPRKGAA